MNRSSDVLKRMFGLAFFTNTYYDKNGNPHDVICHSYGNPASLETVNDAIKELTSYSLLLESEAITFEELSEAFDRNMREEQERLYSKPKRVKFTRKERKSIFIKYGNKCLSCGSNEDLCLDHVIPLGSGGDDDLENLQPLCKTCNSKKGTKTIDYRPEIISNERD